MNSSPPNPSEPLPLTQNENPWARSHSGLPWMLLVKNVLGASASNRNRTALPTRPSTKLAEPFSLGGANRISSIDAMTPASWALTGGNAARNTSAAKTTILNTAPPLGASSPIAWLEPETPVGSPRAIARFFHRERSRSTVRHEARELSEHRLCLVLRCSVHIISLPLCSSCPLWFNAPRESDWRELRTPPAGSCKAHLWGLNWASSRIASAQVGRKYCTFLT